MLFLTSLKVSWKAQLTRLPLLWPDSEHSQAASAFSSGTIVKDNQQQLFNITRAWGSDSSWGQHEANQKFKRTSWDIRYSLVDLKSSDIFPGILKTKCIYGSVHAQERPEDVRFSHLWMALKLCASRQWRLRQNCKLPAFLSTEVVPQHTYVTPWQKPGDLLVSSI